MYVCDRLKAGSLKRFQKETTHVQLLKWLKYFNEKDAQEYRQEVERVEKWEHYFAELFVLLKSIYKPKGAPQPVHEKELLKFEVPKPKVKKKVTREERAKEAKVFWAAFFAAHEVMQKQDGVKKKVL